MKKTMADMRTALNETKLAESEDLLKGIADVCRSVKEEKGPFNQLCREHGLDPAYTRRLILIFLGKCKDERVDFTDLRFNFTDNFETFYREVFGDRSLTAGRLPVDYKDAVLYVIKETGLTDMESKLITLHFGLEDGIPMTFKDTGDKFGLSPERVQRIFIDAIRKCRTWSRRSILTMGLAEWTRRKEYMNERMQKKLEFEKEEQAALMAKDKEEHRRKMDLIKTMVKSGNGEKTLLDDGFVIALKDVGVDVLHFSARVSNSLRRSDVESLFDLIKKDDEELERTRDIGVSSMAEIHEKLNNYVNAVYNTTVDVLRARIKEMGTGSPVNSLTLAAQIGWLLNMPKKDQNAVYDELSQLPEGPLKQAMTCLVNCVRSRYIACIRSESIRGAQYETTADSDFLEDSEWISADEQPLFLKVIEAESELEARKIAAEYANVDESVIELIPIM